MGHVLRPEIIILRGDEDDLDRPRNLGIVFENNRVRQERAFFQHIPMACLLSGAEPPSDAVCATNALKEVRRAGLNNGLETQIRIRGKKPLDREGHFLRCVQIEVELARPRCLNDSSVRDLRTP